jgi:predicted HTH transcriptional regulator
LDVLKAIAGFLNTKGGTLFIGVGEEGTALRVRGLAEDLEEMGGSKDKLRLTLRHLITDWIGSAYSHLITDELKEYGGCCYWEVAVAAAPEPVFVWWKPKGLPKEKRFFVREGPKTSDLDNESTWHYIKNKWG